MYLYFANEGEHCELLPFHIITAGINHNQEPRYRPDGASFHHIFFIEEGEGIFETSAGTFTLEKGTAVFLSIIIKRKIHFRLHGLPLTDRLWKIF